ncbi:PREDICTED: zinc finger protein 341-like [Wasmannia auropunctata]|uniref:zinc finger protein 341-like n=1 Tax=Wasmannia auropunctata TaxID=64793 RepID=UPI0005F0BA32|nr:PREDICTED: zinc finger protein 341-like [Wasmannia auropunctata]
MAQSILDALTDVSLDGSSVQSLLDSQTLIAEVEQSAIDQDEEDIFQCGKCKSQFTSLQMFVLHKRAHQRTQQQTVDLTQFLTNDESQVMHVEDVVQDESQYNSQETFQLGEPIILEETDMLFSVDQEAANYFMTDSTFSVPIILSTENLDAFGAIEATREDSCEVPTVLQNDISSQEDASSQSEHLSASLTDNEPSLADNEPPLEDNESSLENNETSLQENSLGENGISRMQNLKYKCGYCNKQFAKKFYWQQHERSHTGEKPYQCVVCGRAFAQKSNVKKHMSSHKVWPGTAIHSLPPEAPPDGSIDRTYHCQFCKETFDSYKALKGHLIVSHLALKVYKCVQSSCSMMFSDLEEFLEHTRSHKCSEYRCHVCGEVFSTLSDLGRHQYVHSVQKQKTTEKYYCCSTCKSSFSNLEALQHHKETTTHNYACLHCGKSFLIERFLRRHLKTHSASARFACEDCGKAFKTEQYLANHKLIHSEETPFTCPDCPARFKRKDRLGRHMLIHDLTKRLKCPFRNYLGCMSEFSRPDKLKRHLLTHSNVKRFSCSHCNRNFHRAQALKHHEMNKHSLKCDICSHAFKTKEQLVTHNCEQSSETKKHTSSQLPKKASGSFKPRKPTPKRQTISKTAIPLADKEKLEKLKADEMERKIASETFKSESFDEESSIKTEGPPVLKVESTGGELNERSDSPVMDFESDFKRNMDFYSPHASE